MIVTSFSNHGGKLQNENQTDETLMNKGFQGTIKNMKAKQYHSITLFLSMNFKK